MNAIDALLKLRYCLESTDIDPDLAIKYQFSEQLLSEYALASNQEYFDQDHFLPVSNQLPLSDLYEKTKIEFIINATCIYSPSSIGEPSEFNEGLSYFSHSLTPG